MTDATILIPTFRHAALVPYSLRSALTQEGAVVEVFVVGDGVEEDTRVALAPFLSDPRVRFFDFPKGERNGELSRHEALQEASGRIVCYLSDDDLLLRDHVTEMARLLDGADFAHSAPLFVMPDGSLMYAPVDVARPRFQALLRRGDWNHISLTGTAHTLAAYRRLPHGWRPAPHGIWSDLYMWQQLLRLPDFRGRTARRLTHLHFPDSLRRDMTVTERVAELDSWWNRMQQNGFADDLARAAAEVVQDTAVEREAWIYELKGEIREMQATQLWRLRTRVATSWPLRELLARRREAR